MLRVIRSLILLTILFNIIHRFNTDSINEEEFIYPGKAKSERDLSTCKPYEVCSIVHKRFWFARQVERFCRCDRNECPSAWSSYSDNFTMALNNRAQMKFCEPVKDLPDCLKNQTKNLQIMNQTETETVNNTIVENFKIISKAECYCPPHHIWVAHNHQQNGTTAISSYRCANLAKCNIQEFCGFERTDYYSTYYKCSCPTAYLCVRQNDTISVVKEIFYNGNVYKNYCNAFPVPGSFLLDNQQLL